MAVTELQPPTNPPADERPEPLVPVYRVQWTFDNLTQEQLRALPKEIDGDSVDADGDAVYFAKKTATPEEVWAWIAARLALVADSDVVVCIEEIPLSEWIGSYSGAASDAEERS